MGKTGLSIIATVLALGALAAQPARADGGFSVNIGGGGGYYDRGYRHYDGWHDGWRRGHYYSPSYGVYPAYPGYAPIYAPPPPPVIYAPAPATTIIVPPPQPPVVYQQGAMPADQASQTFTNAAGQTCREYQSNITVGGQQQPAYGTACLQPDGTWRVTQ